MIDIKEAKPPKEHLTTYRLAHLLVAWLQQTYPEAHDLLAQDAQSIEDDIAPFFSPRITFWFFSTSAVGPALTRLANNRWSYLNK